MFCFLRGDTFKDLFITRFLSLCLLQYEYHCRADVSLQMILGQTDVRFIFVCDGQARAMRPPIATVDLSNREKNLRVKNTDSQKEAKESHPHDKARDIYHCSDRTIAIHNRPDS